MWTGKKVILGITGSIAAYKVIFLTRLLVKQGADVKVIMTPSAKDFVTPLSLSTLSGHEVLSDLYDGHSWANHVALGRWADIMLIAPLSCNTLAKMANGLCDNLLLATYLSATCPVVLAPAMDEDMWHHPATRANLEKVKAFGNRVIDVEIGPLASGLHGEGRMAEPERILQFMEEFFFFAPDLKGRTALVSAGPTYEAIDPVRFIGNHSSGKMGLAIARELTRRGAKVTLVLGPSALFEGLEELDLVRVQSADEMYRACITVFPGVDIAVMAAAVADYTPTVVAAEKIKKKEGTLILELVKTADILQKLGQLKTARQVLVGFALENQDEHEYAMKKLQQKGADIIVLNSLRDEGAGFGFDTNKVTIFQKDAPPLSYGRKSKQQVAKDIVDKIANRLYE